MGEEEGGENARKKEGADREGRGVLSRQSSSVSDSPMRRNASVSALNGSSTEDKERDKRKTGANQKYSSVSKRKTSTPLHYLFQCKRWLSLDEGDQQTVAEFAPVKSNGDLLDPNSCEFISISVFSIPVLFFQSCVSSAYSTHFMQYLIDSLAG